MEIKVLLVDTERDFTTEFGAALDEKTEHEHQLHTCVTAESALRLASHLEPDAIFIDERYGERAIKEIVETLRVECPRSVNLLLTASEGIDALTLALRSGARDYLCRARLDRNSLHRALWGVWLRKWRDQQLDTPGTASDELLTAPVISSMAAPFRRARI